MIPLLKKIREIIPLLIEKNSKKLLFIVFLQKLKLFYLNLLISTVKGYFPTIGNSTQVTDHLKFGRIPKGPLWSKFRAAMRKKGRANLNFNSGQTGS